MPTATKYATPISVRIPNRTLEALDEAATRAGVVRSRLVLDALERHLGLATVEKQPTEKDEGSKANADIFG